MIYFKRSLDCILFYNKSQCFCINKERSNTTVLEKKISKIISGVGFSPDLSLTAALSGLMRHGWFIMAAMCYCKLGNIIRNSHKSLSCWQIRLSFFFFRQQFNPCFVFGCRPFHSWSLGFLLMYCAAAAIWSLNCGFFCKRKRRLSRNIWKTFLDLLFEFLHERFLC